jgi:DNA-binding CsgD family transcriptional regulator
MTRGRPEHKPTVKSQARVASMAGGGMSQDEIAAALRIDRNTLAKHYKDDLTSGAAQRREEVLEVVRREALDGNLPAARLYLTGARRAEPLPQVTDASLEIVAMPSQATGVKAQRNEQAKTAQQGTEWQTLLPSSVQ